MSSVAIMMMVLFMVIVWGGLLASILHLQHHPDETSGVFGEDPNASDDVLIAQEL